MKIKLIFTLLLIVVVNYVVNGQEDETNSTIIYKSDRASHCNIENLGDESYTRKLQYFNCENRRLTVDSVKLINKGSDYYISLKIKSKKRFLKMNPYNLSGPIICFYNGYSFSNITFNGQKWSTTSSNGVNYYFYVEGENMMFQSLKAKNILRTLESSTGCNNIVRKIKRKRRTSNGLLIAAGAGFIAAGFLVSEAIRTNEFNPVAPIAGGVSMINVIIALFKKKKIKEDLLPKSVDIYNTSFNQNME